MNIIIVGCGKVGAKLAQILSDDGHDVVIIDGDKDAFDALSPDFNGLTVAGVPIDKDVLKQAGIENADAFAAVSPDDNVNIMASQVAKEIFKVPRVIARIFNPEREHVFHQFGLDTICPTNLTVNVLRSKILGEIDSSHCAIAGQAFTFKREAVKKDKEGKLISELEMNKNSYVFGVMKGGNFMFPTPNQKLEKDDILVMAYLTY